MTGIRKWCHCKKNLTRPGARTCGKCHMEQSTSLEPIAEGPDGALYIATDNGDDVILRVTPQ